MRAPPVFLRYGWRSRSQYTSIGRRPFSSAKPIWQVAHKDDLAKIFDDQAYFEDFNNTSSYKLPFSFKKQETGLFKNEMLSSPSGLVEFSKQSLVDAKSLVEEMLNNTSDEGKLNYIKKLDQLSDILCRVIDVAEFIRIVHPSAKWANAAQKTHEILFEYMNQLNTNVELYTTLIDVLNDSVIASKLTEEEIKVGEYLKQDFERSGIHMDPETRNNFVAITQEISLLGSHFNNEINASDSSWCAITTQDLESIEDQHIKKEILLLQSKYKGEKIANEYYVPLFARIPYAILTKCTSSELRKKVWVALHNSSLESISILDRFVAYRALLSQMLGYKSYAHYQLEHKMAKSPENVVAFLKNIQNSLKSSTVLDELKLLNSFNDEKNVQKDDDLLLDEIKPWDRDLLVSRMQKHKQQDIAVQTKISEYFSVGTVISGLSKLFEKLYNVSFVPEATSSGEVWQSNQVRKLKVIDNGSNQILGYLYLDFWSQKVMPSHFTITCSRRLHPWENISEYKKKVQLDQDYQLPVISLVCNFRDSFQKGPTLLSLDQVDTIFHEMGHAMHSMIGRTELHNLSGTRCATDFVEIPSVLMESFSKDLRVLAKIGRHYQSGEPISESLLQQAHHDKNTLSACETFMQSKMATLDQRLHSPEMVGKLASGLSAINSTEIYHSVEQDLRVFADKWSTWHGKFPHLFSYGAVYYSYLLDRAIAEKLWKGLFDKDPWSHEAGIKYKESVLKWGGTKDPWLCLADALGTEELKEGNSNAMELIGQNASL
ncbi:OCT1 [Candida theae]|uniref:Mitochondrial intermediate peptidase n=1 Tax=Candida theae TaxID=1198502 RepID=A0AAD5BH20_9ASCO|nr:OCT1 [Candida theae]KAI5962764.1 OCT1 [Candida theae]